MPGETALIVAAAYAGHTHRLSVWLIFVLAVTAAVLGDCLGYLAGLKGGYRLLLRWGPVIGLDHAKIKAGWYVFDRHGGKVVFISRFVTVLRTYAAFVAGTNRMRWGRFSLFNVAGGVAWAGDPPPRRKPRPSLNWHRPRPGGLICWPNVRAQRSVSVRVG